MKNNQFYWGTGTSSFQIEGAFNIDHKSPSIWDDFAHKKGNILNDDNGDIACDHYHLFKTDIALLKELGVNSYRFSISWPRIFPNDNFEVNELGIKYYIDIVDELIKRNIIPFVTLYHWDMPSYILKDGGFENRQIVEKFKKYVEVVVTRLKGKVKNYITINEPQCVVEQGYKSGTHAPGYRLTSDKRCLNIVHNILLCHGEAVRVIRNIDPTASVGIAMTANVSLPIREDEELIKKVKEKYFSIKKSSFYGVSLYSDPVFLKDYPKEYYSIYKNILPDIKKGDLEIISTPIDFCYQNIYTGNLYDLSKNHHLINKKWSKSTLEGTLSWLKFAPESLYYGPKFLFERYKKPVIISENGFCEDDRIINGQIVDTSRKLYISSYISSLEKAREEGIDIRGYFYWSLLDNFEWAYGYQKRFGLLYVDFSSQKRIKKDSFKLYKEIIKKHTGDR